jgi:hypothetical protein
MEAVCPFPHDQLNEPKLSGRTDVHINNFILLFYCVIGRRSIIIRLPPKAAKPQFWVFQSINFLFFVTEVKE